MAVISRAAQFWNTLLTVLTALLPSLLRRSATQTQAQTPATNTVTENAPERRATPAAAFLPAPAPSYDLLTPGRCVPTMKQRIRAEAHGSAPSSGRSRDAVRPTESPELCLSP